MAAIDFSLQNRTPDGNGKLLVGDLSPTDGSYTTEAQYKTWIQQDITDGTITAKKAERDQNGNVIDTTYATKVEVNDVKNALDATNKRVDNLEEKAGDYTEVDVKSVYSVPTGKASNMVLVGVEGRTRVNNNLATNQTFTNTTTDNRNTIAGQIWLNSSYFGSVDLNVTGQVANILTPNADGTMTIKHSGNLVDFTFIQAPVINGHKYLYAITVAGHDPSTVGGVSLSGMIFTDLTQYFNGSIPSDADTIAKIQTNYPWLLSPSSYGTSMVKTRYEGFTSIGANRWDEEWVTGVLTSDGSIGTGSNRRTTSFIEVLPSTEYDIPLSSAWGGRIAYYDVNKNCTYYNGSFSASSGVFTTDANTRYVRYTFGFAYGTTYNHDVMFCLNSLTDKSYKPYSVNTLSLPTPIELGSAGSVADTHDLESGVTTYNTVDIDLGALTENDWQGTSPVFYILTTDSRFSNLVQAPNNTTALNAIVDKGIVPIARQTMYNDSTQNMVACDSGAFYIKLNSLGSTPTKAQVVAFLDGVHLVGGAITPSTSQGTPLLDNLIQTEGGGTLEAVKTYPIDDSFTVGYLTL